MLFINKYYLLRGGNFKGTCFSVTQITCLKTPTFLSEKSCDLWDTLWSSPFSIDMHHCQELFSDLTQEPNSKYPSSLLFGTAEHLLACFMPLDFFIVLGAESHITSIHLPQKLGILGENVIFIYLQFGISLICLVYGSRFYFGWHSSTLYLDIFRPTWWSAPNCLLVHISVLLPCKIENFCTCFSPNMWDFPGIGFQTAIYSCDCSCNSRHVRLLFLRGSKNTSHYEQILETNLLHTYFCLFFLT